MSDETCEARIVRRLREERLSNDLPFVHGQATLCEMVAKVMAEELGQLEQRLLDRAADVVIDRLHLHRSTLHGIRSPEVNGGRHD